jgi:hypothetical protein
MQRRTLWLGAVAMLVLAGGCDTDDESHAPAGPPPSPVVRLAADAIRTAGISTAPVERRRLEQQLDLTGTLAAVPWTAEEQAAIAEAVSLDAERQLEETSYERQERLAAQGIVSRQALDAARAAREAARAAAASADARLANLGLGGGDSDLARQARIWGLAQLPESELADVAAGAAVRVTPAAYPEREFEAHVVAVSASSDPATHAFTVRIAVRDPQRVLRPQMLAAFRIAVRRPAALVVPRSAILLEGDGSWVYVAADGAFRRTEIRTGAATATEVEVASGLTAGDQVVVAGAQLLESERLKSTVRISD